MASPDRPDQDDDRALPPLPKERWKGPPESIPDEDTPKGRGCLNPLIMVGSLALMAWGLYAALYVAIVVRWTMGGYFGFFLKGLCAAILGTALIWSAEGRRRAAPSRNLEFGTPAANGCLATFMLLAGFAMLLPGLCSVLFGFGALNSFTDLGDQGLLLTGLVLGAVGLAALWWVSTRPASVVGLIMAIGIVLFVPGLYVVLYGISRVYWINHLQAPLLPLGLPAGAAGILWFRAARRALRAEATVGPLAVPPESAPDS